MIPGMAGHNPKRAAFLAAELEAYDLALSAIIAATGWTGLFVDRDAHRTEPSAGILGTIDGQRAAICRRPNGSWSARRGTSSSMVRATGPDAVTCALALRAAFKVAA